MDKATGKKVRIENDKRFTAIFIDGEDTFRWAEGPFAGKSTCEKITVVDTDKGRTKAEEVAVKALRILNGKLAKDYKVVEGQDILDELEAAVDAAKAKKKVPKNKDEKIGKLKEKVEKVKEKIAKAQARLEELKKDQEDMTKEIEELEKIA